MFKKISSSKGSITASSLVIVMLAMIIFAAAVGIGVSLLGGSEPSEPVNEPTVIADASEVEPEDEPEEQPEDEPEEEPEDEPEGSSAITSSATVESSNAAPATVSSSASASASTSASATASASAPAAAAAASAVPAAFDPASMGESGQKNIASYKQINSDVKAWLKVPGTNINYPVLQSAPGYDAHYYLDKNIYRQTSRDGVIYAGSTAKFGTGKTGLSKNTVMFGHNWTNVSANPRIGNASDVMFAQLTAYHHLNFAKAYPYIWFSTDSAEMQWVVFAAFYTDVSFMYIDPNPTDSNHAAVIKGAKDRSRHDFGVDVNSSDRIITLSTCTRAYGQSDQQRFVVMARQLRDGETLTAINVAANPDPILPKL